MRRKNSNVLRFKDVFTKDKKIKEVYSKLKLVLLRHKKNSPFVIAVSGGPDSMALAALSHALMKEKELLKDVIIKIEKINKKAKYLLPTS